MEEARGLIITAVVTVTILIGGAFLLSKGSPAPKSAPVNSSVLVHSDSHQTNPGAKITIVEFGDYRCPACKAAFPTVQQLIKEYGNKINFVFRNYVFLPDSPTNSTPTASLLAANAAECASDQNKFWEMHDYLYKNQPSESDIKMYNLDSLTKAAVSLGIDGNKFNSCLSNKVDNERIKQDFADGQLAGVVQTPTFFVNGNALSAIPSYDDFKTLIDSLLKK